MKKIYILLLVIIFYTTTSAQNYFPTANAIWNESVQDNNSYYGLLGDTIINDRNYSKLYQFSDTVLSIEKVHSYIGAIRNEGQKVFFLTPYEHCEGQEYIDENCPEILMYDFGAKQGDTVWHNAILRNYFEIYFSPDSYSVIWSVQIENNRKIFSVKGPVFFNIWYEGIGSIMGILRSITTSPYSIEPSKYNLNCFKHFDVVEYLYNPKCNKCFCVAGSIFEKDFSDILTVFPSPATNILYFNIPENTEIKSIAIFSTEGKLIERNMYSYNLGELNISKIKAGNYLIQIQTNNNTFNKLIIKQ